MAKNLQRPPKNAVDAYALLASELAAYRALSYDQLVELVETRDSRVVRANDSIEYAIDIVVRWQKGVPGDIRVDGSVAVDDCGPLRRMDDHFVVCTLAPS